MVDNCTALGPQTDPSILYYQCRTPSLNGSRPGIVSAQNIRFKRGGQVRAPPLGALQGILYDKGWQMLSSLIQRTSTKAYEDTTRFFILSIDAKGFGFYRYRNPSLYLQLRLGWQFYGFVIR